MKTLRDSLKDYLAMRRGLGYKLHQEGVQLPKFISFMQKRKADYITTALALEWSQQSESGQFEPGKRFARVRVFAKYMRAIDPRTEILPDDFFPRRTRGRPYLYDDEEVRRLLAAAKNWSRAEQPRGTYYCLFGLLIASGLRVGEAIRLEMGDVDLTKGVLTIRGTKFGKSRLVPLHPTTMRALRNYRRRRDALPASQFSPYFFMSRKGTKLFHTSIYHVFNSLSVKVGLRKSIAGRGPRLHDFRHRFAVRTLINWYRAGKDVECCLPILATYLGHVSVTGTYWYLTGHPELMRLASQRLNARWDRRI